MNYQLLLAERLLKELSGNEQHEKSMIGKLKNEAGYHWTSKLEGMFKDIQRSKELTRDFKGERSDEAGLDISVSVCTTGSWPSSNLPRVSTDRAGKVVAAVTTFKKFYNSRHNCRKINFRWDQGLADVQVKFSKNTTKTLVCSTYQMLVLLLFNYVKRGKPITFGDMRRLTDINAEDLETHVMSMAHPKVKIFRKKPNNNQIADDHKFGINPSYKNKAFRVHVPLFPSKERTNEQDKKHKEAVRKQREHQMDAAIVRVMKTRQHLKYKILIGEVTKQLQDRFAPSVKDIRKRVEVLIAQEYMERDENDRTQFNYLA